MQGHVASLEDLVWEITSGSFHVILPLEVCHEEHANGAMPLENSFIV